MEKLIDEIVKWIKDRVYDAKANGVVFGLSGGIDSAVVAALAKKAFPESSLGIIMPCHSNPIDEEHALLVADAIGLKVEKVDLTRTYDVLLDSIPYKSGNKMALANIKPRLRMTTLYYYAQSLGYLVLGSGNKSELTVGYFTKYGDSGVDILPIASFTKTQVRKLAEYLNIPRIIIDKPPTAGLWENQTDEKEMGFSYDVLDRYIETKTGPEGIIEKIEHMNRISEHKRNMPSIFKPM
ncbi:MAG TPA: NAD(+) synthase [Tissierellia bacterium]|nr:NAD(+) synthase [Tissierellia bacterium]